MALAEVAHLLNSPQLRTEPVTTPALPLTLATHVSHYLEQVFLCCA